MALNKPKRKRSARVEQKRRETRREILQAAAGILSKSGIEAVTLANVAEKLQLTKQALYHYFPSKEALLKSLTATLLDDEVEAIVAALEKSGSNKTALGTMIRAFYTHYISRLDSFRAVYCQPQLISAGALRLDETMLREEINPRTRHLFDILEERLSEPGMKPSERAQLRRLAFSAWLSALGLLSMLSLADANQDPLIHSDRSLLTTLIRVFDEAADR